MITPFLLGITQAFGKPFLKVHHTFAFLGLVFVTLHPVFNSIERLNLSVFVPRFDSWNLFWLLAGRLGFILGYIATFAVLLRAKALECWRLFHAVMYVVLFLGLVHANLIGNEFQNLAITIIFNVLFATTLASFEFKSRSYQLNRRISL